MSDPRQPDDGVWLDGPGADFDRLDPDGAGRVAAEKLEADRQAEKRRQLLRRLLGDAEVRAFIREFLDDCHAFEPRFASTGYSPDPYGTFLYAGEQKAGWHLWAQLDEAAPELASLMRREDRQG